MNTFLFFTVIQAIVAAALVGVVLMQRSEGGGLGMGGGGSPGGVMGARGSADFLTRTTKWLAVAFVGLSILLAAMAVDVSTGGSIDASLDRTVAPAANPDLVPVEDGGTAASPNGVAPASDDPLAGVAE